MTINDSLSYIYFTCNFLIWEKCLIGSLSFNEYLVRMLPLVIQVAALITILTTNAHRKRSRARFHYCVK